MVIVFHFLFMIFVVAGGCFLTRYPRIIWFHLPAAIWGVLVQVMHWPCPLTPLEQWLRSKASMPITNQDFISHYLLKIIYPEGLTPTMQTTIGLAVLFLNGMLYRHYFKNRHNLRHSK